MKKSFFSLSRLFVSIVTVGIVTAFFCASPIQAQTQPWAEGTCVKNGVATIQGLQCLIGNILSVAVSGIGLIGFVMLIVGSFRLLLSGGQAKGVESGRSTITYAVLGLVVALASFMILQLVADFTGVKSILNFQIPSSTTNFTTQ
jgi:hypothetical protein